MDLEVEYSSPQIQTNRLDLEVKYSSPQIQTKRLDLEEEYSLPQIQTNRLDLEVTNYVPIGVPVCNLLYLQVCLYITNHISRFASI